MFRTFLFISISAINSRLSFPTKMNSSAIRAIPTSSNKVIPWPDEGTHASKTEIK